MIAFSDAMIPRPGRRVAQLASMGVWLAITAAVAGAYGQAKPSSPGSASPAANQTQLPARWWRDDAIASRLGLTKAQANRIDETFNAFLPAQRERWAQLKQRDDELSELLRQPAPAEAKVISQIDLVEKVRFEMNRNRQLMLFRIRHVLSPMQRHQLDALDGTDKSQSASSSQH